MYEHIFDQEVQKKMDDFFLKNLASHGKLLNAPTACVKT